MALAALALLATTLAPLLLLLLDDYTLLHQLTNDLGENDLAALALLATPLTLLLLLLLDDYTLLHQLTNDQGESDDCAPATNINPVHGDNPAVSEAAQLPAGSSLAEDLQANEAALATLRAAFLGAGGVEDAFTDIFLLRWLLAFDRPEAAATKLAASTRWRAEKGCFAVRTAALSGAPMMDISPVLPTLLREMPALPAHGSARDGGPLNIVAHDDLDPQSLMRALSPDEYLRGMLSLLECNAAAADQSSAASGSLARVSFVLCYGSLRHDMISLRFIGRYLSQCLALDAHYPNLVGTILCVNAPAAFARGYGLVKRWISEDIRGRIRVEEPATSAAAIAELAGPESLPTAFGGSCARLSAQQADAAGWSRVPIDERRRLWQQSKLAGYLLHEGEVRVEAEVETEEEKAFHGFSSSLGYSLPLAPEPVKPVRRPWWAACFPIARRIPRTLSTLSLDA